MFGWRGIRVLAGKIACQLGAGGWLKSVRQPMRCMTVTLEELEERVVPTLLGQQLFPADYPWNQNISKAPVAANSAAIITHIGTAITVHPDWGDDNPDNGTSPLYGIPVNIVHGNSTPAVDVIIDNYPGESDIVPVPIPANAVVEGDYQNGPNPNGGGYNDGQRGDSHLIVWDEDNNIAYELYGVTRPTDPTLFPNNDGVELPHTDAQWHAAQETVWNMNTDSFRTLGYTSADAAGLSILAGLARPDEGLPVSDGGQGAIDHALRLTLPSGDVNPQYIYPASHIVSDSERSTSLPFGARLRLMDTPAVNAMISTMGPEAQIIARAMQQYGLVVADIGSAMYVTGASASPDANNNVSLTWNMDDVLGLEALTAGDFQVVNLRPVVSGLSAATASPGGTITISGKNFSGSAGNLTVFFGATPTTSTTFVSDSQIIAVVPHGSGAVNVTVQSGINEADTDDGPGANVNAPIFGYGTSAISAADRFTFARQTISATGSSAGFVHPSDASGTTDVLTFTITDTSGKAVHGLPSSAFVLSLSGGASTGTFGPVTATSTAGTYDATFSGSVAGTASTVTAIVEGVTLTAAPTIMVTPGAVSRSKSKVNFAGSSVASGSTDSATIMVEDGAGNAITGLAGSAFQFKLSGASTGTFGSVSETGTPGTYTAVFTGVAAGVASGLKTSVNGVTLTAEPAVTVTAGPVSGATSKIACAAAAVASGNADTVTIIVKDAAGNAVSGLITADFAFSLSGGASAGAFGIVTETTTKGTYRVTFTGTMAGTASTLTATVNGVALINKPTITVSVGAVSRSNSTAEFAAATVTSGSTDTVTIVVEDGAGNAVSGLAGSAFHLSLSGGTSAGTFGMVTETATKGTYTATFTATRAGTGSSLTATVSAVILTTKPTITVMP